MKTGKNGCSVETSKAYTTKHLTSTFYKIKQSYRDSLFLDNVLAYNWKYAWFFDWPVSVPFFSIIANFLWIFPVLNILENT